MEEKYVVLVKALITCDKIPVLKNQAIVSKKLL